MTMSFLSEVAAGAVIEPQRLSRSLRISQNELASTLGVSRDAVSKRARVNSPSVQQRLREMTDIINRVLPWAGSTLAAYAWYRSQSLPSFGDMTAEELVQGGRADDVRTYLGRIALGGYA